MLTKTHAVNAFGSVLALANAMGLTSRQAIYKKPEVLSQEDEDRIRGAALRLGISIPAEPKPRRKAEQAKAA